MAKCGECLYWPPEPGDADSGCSTSYLADPEDEAGDCFEPKEQSKS